MISETDKLCIGICVAIMAVIIIWLCKEMNTKTEKRKEGEANASDKHLANDSNRAR